MSLAAWAPQTFASDGIAHCVYQRGEGPGVIVLPEIPGITPEVEAFAESLVDGGYAVWLVSLFGVDGAPRSPASVARTLFSVCVRREIALFSRGDASRLTPWLRALARHVHAEAGGVGVGLVGMCLTGGFAIATATEEAVRAAVMSQPSQPIGWTAGHRADLGLDVDGEALVAKRAAEGALGVFALRFTGDALVPRARFDALRRCLGDALTCREIPSGRGQPHGPAAHSVLTNDARPGTGEPTAEAHAAVLAFLARWLRTAP
jgi:dienelactone hydrolase